MCIELIAVGGFEVVEPALDGGTGAPPGCGGDNSPMESRISDISCCCCVTMF